MALVKERVNPMSAIEAPIERLSDRRFDGRFGFDGGLEGTGAAARHQTGHCQRP